MRHITLRSILGASVAAYVVLAAAPSWAQSRTFKVPAQRAVSGIPEFARQADIQILVSDGAVRGKTTVALNGAMSVEAGLQRLIAGTGLKIASTDGRTFTLAMREAPRGNGAGEPARLASASTSQDAGDVEVGDIVVTARKRLETVQTIPISVRAVGEQELLKLGADSIQQVVAVTPGIQTTGNRTNSQIVVRGVTTGPVNHDQAEIKETVGVYLDETPVAVQRYSPNFTIYDLARVEILRGPQGTLYGAGSMAGALRYITNKPNAGKVEASGRASLSTIDHGGTNYRGDAMLNLPVIEDRLAVRAVGSFRKNGGFIDNVVTGKDDSNSDKSYSGRLMVRATPSSDTIIDAMLLYQRSDINAVTTYAQEAGYLKTTSGLDEPTRDRNLVASLTVNQQLDLFDITASGAYRRKKYEYFAENGSFTHFITGFQDTLGGNFENHSNQRDYNGELRLSSKPDSAIEWTVGVYYEKRDNFYGQDFSVPGVDAVAGIDSTDFGANADQLYFSAITLKEKQFAAFGEVVIPVTSKLKLTGGGRYFRSSQKAAIDFRGVFAFPNVGLSTFSNKENGFNPRVNLSWKIDAERMMYAQAAKGFRLGGTNEPVPVPACSADLASRGLTEAPESFKSDSLWNYEVGAKTSWLSRRLTVNVSAYRVDWKKPQVTDQLGCGFNVFVNAGGLRIYGGELETAFSPVRNLSLRANLGYTDSELTKDTVFVSGLKGDHAPYIAKWTYSLGADVRYPLTDELNATFFASYSNVSSRYTRFDRTAANTFRLPSYGVLTARAGIAKNGWSVDLFAENLTNEKAIIDKRFNPYKTVPATYITPITPRTIGLEVSFRY